MGANSRGGRLSNNLVSRVGAYSRMGAYSRGRLIEALRYFQHFALFARCHEDFV